GEGDATGPWNSGGEWDRIDNLEQVMPADGGDGMATVKLNAKDKKVAANMAERTLSDPASDPMTGADIGAGPGAGRTKNGDMGGAANIQEAPARAGAAARKTR
ncbi:MAG: manganese catalase family protein, partial [Mesorhizobium sp.]